MDVPFDIQYGDLTDEDYAALDRYYCQPYYNRDSSEIEHIRSYDWVRASHTGKAKPPDSGNNEEEDRPS